MAKKKNNSNFKQLSTQLRTRAKTIQKRANGEWTKLEREFKTLEKRAKRSDAFGRAKKARRDLDSQLGQFHSQLLGAFGLASRSELDKLTKKLNTVSRKVNGLAKAA